MTTNFPNTNIAGWLFITVVHLMQALSAQSVLLHQETLSKCGIPTWKLSRFKLYIYISVARRALHRHAHVQHETCTQKQPLCVEKNAHKTRNMNPKKTHNMEAKVVGRWSGAKVIAGNLASLLQHLNNNASAEIICWDQRRLQKDAVNDDFNECYCVTPLMLPRLCNEHRCIVT